MKTTLYTLLFLCLTCVGCSEDSSSGTITISQDGLFVANFGESISATFSTYNVGNVAVYQAPEGWTVNVSNRLNQVTVTAPASDENEEEMTGLVALYAYTPDGSTIYETFDVGKIEFIELDDVQANSMIVTKPATFYSFNPNRRGEREEEEIIKAADCRVEWRTSYSPVKYVQMLDDGRIGFYVNVDENDYDGDGDDTDIIEGNAVISALSGNGEVLWSWHIWVAEEEYSEVNINGVTFMDRNIGAFMNCNEYVDEDLEKEDAIYASYGLYYQWGRKDPMIYPSSYNASANGNPPIYDADGYLLDFDYYDSTSDIGHVSYTVLYPRIFITATDESYYDWVYYGSDPALWGDGGEKSIYDPSPKGWRVPSMADFEKIAEPDGLVGEEEDYGAILSGELFMALGRRVYLDGSVQNYAPGELFKPWSGYYWSREVASDGASGEKMGAAFHFYLDEETKEVKINRAGSDYRSTGMQIRPVKM